jgi:phage terminase large subunit GpA-like protein
MKQLTALKLDDTLITDAGLKEVAELKQLTMLSLWDTMVTDAGLKESAGLRQLTTLYLSGTLVRGEGLGELAGLMRLTTLYLEFTRLTEAGLKELAGLNQVTSLNFSFTVLMDEAGLRESSDAGLRKIAGMSQLNTLYLRGTLVTDAGLKHLSGMSQLSRLDLSVTQHAMNLKLQDEAAFFAEYQNEPLPEEVPETDELSADQITAKVNRRPRGEVPLGCNHVTAFIDVQATLLYYVVACWDDEFGGYVIDYGIFPDQHRAYFTLRDARHTLLLATKASGLEGAIYAGLERLTGDLLAREWPREDGAVLRIERCLIDANWGNSTDVVYQFCRQSAHASIVMPSHGRFVGAASQPFSEYKRKPGDRVGHNWRIPNVRGKRAVRHVVYDTNYWKSFSHARLAVAKGDRGCLSLFGERPEQHRLLAEHLTAEYRVKTEGRGRTVDEWKMRPERGDNHWFDCLVGCAVAASMQGTVLFGTEAVRPQRRQRVSFADLQRRRQT